MKPVLLLFLCGWFPLVPGLLAAPVVLDSCARLEQEGRFREAGVLLQHELKKPGLSAADRVQLEFELERLDRVRKDYRFTEAMLFSSLRQALRDLTHAEYEQWVREGRFDSRVIDDQTWFLDTSVPNLFFRYPNLAARRIQPKEQAGLDREHWESCLSIRKTALAQNQPYVLPKRFLARMTLEVDPRAVPNGEMIRAWLPIPREYPFQTGFRLISSTPEAVEVGSETSSARNVYLQERAPRSAPCRFQIDYEYTAYGVWFEVIPSRVTPFNPALHGLASFTNEAPHVSFTPEIRQLSVEIAGSETNPYLMAKKFYEWISQNIRYSFAPEYSTIHNLSDYCLKHGYGDCGEEALLFITLCRLNGIPARWQSGWNTFPGAKSIHDWSEIYMAPYGWIPVDPYMGIYAMRYATSLTPEQRQTVRDFYFGGLDPYRMAANSDHSQTLSPPKHSPRSDGVDFQRGELEWGDHNIYFDQFSYSLTVRELPLSP